MSFLEQVTPVLITWNEAVNVERTLAPLSWASDIVVVDSGSTDGTLELLGENSRVRVFQHAYESPGGQWRFALEETGIETPWVLHLDADHIVTTELIAEIDALNPGDEVAGFEVRFTYCVHGTRLRGSLYPPKVVLFRRDRGRFVDDGHTHRLQLSGLSAALSGSILHDDRKDVSRWFESQLRYSLMESRKLESTANSELSFADRIRKLCCIAPFAVFGYCLLMKGGILDGRAGISYALQRMVAESLLALRLMEGRFAGVRTDDDRRSDRG
ncbi:MAG: glycosyltransferase family 2 protein [Acidobacteriota bacterium]|nr:glycosyltransferase family 2 protein [Acidobacteriota bacterium]